MPNRRSSARQRLEVQIPRLWTEDEALVSKVANRQAQDPASGVADHRCVFEYNGSRVPVLLLVVPVVD